MSGPKQPAPVWRWTEIRSSDAPWDVHQSRPVWVRFDSGTAHCFCIRPRCRDSEGSWTFMDASLYLVSRKEPVQLIDVRRPEEWAAGHVETAVNIPLADLEARLGELDPGLPVLAVRSEEHTSELESRL